MKPESILRERVVRALRARGAFVRVTHGDGHTAGALDLTCVYRGRPVFIELKTPDNKVGMSPLQLREQALIKKAGGIAEEARSVERAIEILDYIDMGYYGDPIE